MKLPFTLEEQMENDSGICGIQDWEIQERCDGCGHMASKLVPIGDGSIKVCGACYAEATVMVFTQLDTPLRSPLSCVASAVQLMRPQMSPLVPDTLPEKFPDTGPC